MPKERAFLRILLLVFVLVAIAAAAGAWALLHSDNLRYRAYELVYASSFRRYDAIIQDVAKSRNLDPMLIKAVVWRESRFRPDKVGLDGERGLMQITDAAASEWVKSERVASFVPADLFDPKINLEAGTWILARSLRRYQDRDDPVPFALAEYNAGRSRVARWAGDREREREKDAGGTPGAVTGSKELEAKIDIPSTKHYVDTVMTRVRFYHERGHL